MLMCINNKSKLHLNFYKIEKRVR